LCLLLQSINILHRLSRYCFWDISFCNRIKKIGCKYRVHFRITGTRWSKNNRKLSCKFWTGGKNQKCRFTHQIL